MPRLGLGRDFGPDAIEGVVTTINDFVFESFSAGQMHPILTTSRTNLVTHSEQIGSNGFQEINSTIVADQTTSPDGTQNADLLKENTALNTHVLFKDFNLSSEKTFTISIFAKSNGANRNLRLDGGGVGWVSSFGVNFDLTNGTASSGGVIDSVGNGWFRCSVTATTSTTASRLLVYSILNSTTSYTGDGSSGVFLYGFQIEQDGFISAYIPTSGSTVTVSTTLNDTSEVWDFDGTDIMIAEDPESEGFWEESYPDGASLPELVLNGDYEELGSDLILNGDFASGGSNWGLYQTGSSTVTFPDVASINIDGSNNNVGLFQENVFTNAKTYKIVLTMKATASFDAEILESQGASTVNAIGNVSLTTSYQEFTFYYKGTGTNDLFIHRLSGETAGQNQQILIKNVLVKQVDPNNRWTLGTGWSIEGGKAVATSCTNENLVGALSILIGNAYEVTFTVSDYSGSGTVKPMLGVVGAVSGATVNADGTYTQILVADANQSVIAFRAGGTAFNGKIDNVSIKEYAIQPLDI